LIVRLPRRERFADETSPISTAVPDVGTVAGDQLPAVPKLVVPVETHVV
jgi:hypothetical protein